MLVGVLGLLNSPWRYLGGWFKLGPVPDELGLSVGFVVVVLFGVLVTCFAGGGILDLRFEFIGLVGLFIIDLGLSTCLD